MKKKPKELTPQAERLFASTQRAMRGTLDRVLSVSKDTDKGPSKLSRTALADASGVARSGIIKVLSSQANPDLRTLCRIGAELGIPPAFLLLSAEDFSRLTSALSGLQHVPEQSADAPSVRKLETKDIAERALKLAEKVMPKEFVNPFDEATPEQRRQRGEFEAVLAQQKHHSRQSIKAMAVAPAWASVKGDVDAMFSLCTLMGAATNINQPTN